MHLEVYVWSRKRSEGSDMFRCGVSEGTDIHVKEKVGWLRVHLMSRSESCGIQLNSI